MVNIEAQEFMFVEELPKREKSRWAKVWEAFEEARQMTREKGMLVPLKLAADIAGVTYQRIQELCALGTLERVELRGHPFITEASLVPWAKSERKAGRPLKVPQGNREMLKVAMEAGRRAGKERRKR